MPFYKKTEMGITEVPLFIATPDYTLDAGEHETYTYPIDGWYWFDSMDDAVTALTPPKTTVTRAQAKLALNQEGYLDRVNAFMGLETTPVEYKIAWGDSLTFERNSPTVQALGMALGLDNAALDSLFALAATFTAF